MSAKSSRTVTTFPSEIINSLRNNIWELQESVDDLKEVGDGWHLSPVDPTRILALFPTLKLRDGLRLVAFQFIEGGNGNGIVLIWPEDKPVPDLPSDQDIDFSLLNLLQGHLQFHLKMGGWQIQNYFSTVIMPAIEGDGSPRSYLDASIFGREIYEFGAKWHGCDWSTHHIVDRDPFTEGISEGFGTAPREIFPRQDWTLEKELPEDWTPRVTMTAKQSRVEFYTYSGLACQTLYLHRDTYTQGNYQCRSKLDCIASGPGGYIF